MKKELKYFLFGLLIFYFIIFLSPSNLLHFFAYIVSTLFFYKSNKNIQVSLLYSLILALFSDLGVGSRIFRLEPEELNLGIGYIISPMTILILCLLPLSFFLKIRKIYAPDVFIILFLAWSLISFYFFPYSNVLYGIISLGEIILGYYLLRAFLSGKKFIYLSYILISMLLYQSFIGILQYFTKSPLGQFSETVTWTTPYGFTTVEEGSLYRITGTFKHPNYFAAFILALLPFLLLLIAKNRILKIFKFLPIIILFFTYTRAAWFIFIVLIVLLLLAREIRFRIPKEVPLWWYSIPIFFTISFIILTPFINSRINSLPEAFEEWGSFGVRSKLIQEGWSIIEQYPLTGIGLNQSLQFYTENPVTDLFERIKPSSFYRIHNTFLEIAAEIGIPGLIFFVLFLLLVIKHYFENEKTYPKNAAFFGLLGLIGISMFNPFLHASQFRLFFLLAAIILV